MHRNGLFFAGTVLLLAAAIATAQERQNAICAGSLSGMSRSIRALSNRVSPAVVEVQVIGYGAIEEERGQTGNIIERQRAKGSGVVVDPAGFIVTNAHVVRGAMKVTVLLSEKRRVVEASIVGADSESDVALLKIEAKDLPVLRFAPSRSLRQGDLVLAIGSPMGLRRAVSFGVVSATEQPVEEASSMSYVQTDASINPGNSGGALVDMEGRLVGINTFILSQSGGNEGLGFAIPGDTVRDVYRQLKAKGHVDRGDVGISLQDITPALAKGLSLPRDEGVVVADATAEGPADVAGLKAADVLISADGSPISSVRQFENIVYRRQKGEKLDVVALRGGASLKMTLEVKARTPQFDPLAGLASSRQNFVRRFGVFCLEVDKRVADMFPGLRLQYGLVVAAKVPSGRGQFVDLRVGDVIQAINTLPVASLKFLRHTLDGLNPGDAVALQIERDGQFRYVAFDLEE